MNRRERIIAIVVGGFASITVGYLLLNALLLGPLRALAKQEADCQEAIRKLEIESAGRVHHAAKLAKLMCQSLGHDEDLVKEHVRARLAELLASAGLREDRQSLSAIVATPLSSQSKDKSLGWAVSARGKLQEVVDFLFLLEGEPYLHKLENLVLTPKAGELSLELAFCTLIFESPKDKRAATMPAERPGSELGSDSHRLYDLIASRDIFRPYVPKPPDPPPVAPPRNYGFSSPPPPVPPSRPDPRITSLTSWGGKPEIVVTDQDAYGAVRSRIFGLGDPLGSGHIVMVDYRPMPDPEKPDILSGSRVILRIGETFWAIERGQKVSQRRRLTEEQLPTDLLAMLAGEPTTQPSPQVAGDEDPMKQGQAVQGSDPKTEPPPRRPPWSSGNRPSFGGGKRRD